MQFINEQNLESFVILLKGQQIFMKRFILLFLTVLTLNANFTLPALAHGTSNCNCHNYNHCNSYYYPSNFVISEVVNNFDIPVKDCNEHKIVQETTVIYYSNSSPNIWNKYSAYDIYGNLIIDNCAAIEHVVYNNKCYFIIKFYDNKILAINSKTAIISSNNNFIVNNKYNLLYRCDNNRYIVKLNGKYGMIDIEENTIIPIIYSSIDKLSHEIYRVKIDNMYGIINSNGGIILDSQYDAIKPLGNNYYQIKQNKKWGIISNKGEILAPAIYNDVKILNNILYVKDNKNNWIQLNDNIVKL